MTEQEIIKKAQESYNKYFKEVQIPSESIDRHDIMLDVDQLESEIAAMIK